MPTKEEIESWQIDPDAAYAEAERLIAEAKQTGATELDFCNAPSLRALRSLPHSIVGLSNLQRLNLGKTKVGYIEEQDRSKCREEGRSKSQRRGTNEM